MDVTLALEVVARLGTDNPPTLDELTQARDAIARELHALKGQPDVDLEALMALRDTYAVAAQAVTEMHAAANDAAQEVDDILADVPDPDAPEDEGEGEPEGQSGDPVAAGARVLSVREAVARLGLTPQAPARTQPVTDDLAATTTTVTLNGDEVADATFSDMAQAFSRSARNQRVGRERVARIQTEYAAERTLAGKIADNTRLIDSFVSPEAVTAAGGCCSLPTPIYDNPVNGSLDRPIRSSLPTVGATRGKVVFYPPICLPVEGVATWTCEQDAAVVETDESTWKQCVDVECDEEQTADVDAIYSCITVGNFQQRFNPELWEGHLKALSIQQARVAEVTLWNQMWNAVATHHTADATGSVYVSFLNAVGRAAAAIRQDQRLTSVRLNLWIADWIREAIRADLRGRRVKAGVSSDLEATDQLIATALSNEGVDVTYTPDVDPIEPNGQTDGPITEFPTTAHAILAPSGYFSFLDGGTLDFGTEIRDHQLNRQNKLAAFAESFEGLLARGCNAKAFDLPVEVCATVPC